MACSHRALRALRRARAPQDLAALAHALAQKGLKSRHARVVHKAAHDAAAAERVRRGAETHRRVVRHRTAHPLALLRARPLPGEIERLVKAPGAAHAPLLEPAQIFRRAVTIEDERQKAAVRRDDRLGVHAAPQRECADAVCLVAIASRGVECEKRALGDAPGSADAHAPLLGIETKAAAFIQHPALFQRQEERRHEIFKHRPAPARKAAVTVQPQAGAA